jgi:predicted secreted protein
MRHIPLYFFLLLLCTLVLGCNPTELKKEAPAINEIRPGSKFVIILPEDHTTGYLWQLKQDYNEQVVGQINEVWHGNEKGIYFHLRSLAAGQTTLNFVSRKYQDTAEVKQFIIKVLDK